MDFEKLDHIASETLLSLSDQLEPAEVYAVLIIAFRAAQGGLRTTLGDDAEIEIASDAYLHVNNLEAGL